MIRERFACFALRLTTIQGHELAAGGICIRGTEESWKERFLSLVDIEIKTDNMYDIDFELAKALCMIGDKTLIVSGATLRIDAMSDQQGRAGGVVGSPRMSIESAGEEAECLPYGFSLYALPGGPGLAAHTSEEEVEKQLKRIVECGFSEMAFQSIIEEGNADAGILVYDGTGASAEGIIAVFDGEKSNYIRL